MLGRLCLVELLSFIIAILFHTIPGKLVINKTHNELLAVIKDKRSEIVLGPPADYKSILCCWLHEHHNVRNKLNLV